MFCSRCGAQLPDVTVFCSRCGHRMQAPQSGAAAPVPVYEPTARPAAAQPVRRGRKPLRFVLLAAVGIVLAVVLVAALLPDGKPSSGGGLTLGTPIEIGQSPVDADGASLTVEDPASALNGMTLDIPAGAYPDPLVFTFSETSVESHRFGELFTPASPLITIDNGHAFAAAPMELTIPIQKTDDEFAMGFYYDRETGRLEGIPCVAQDNGSITLLTAHFSDVVVSKVSKGLLDGRIQADEADTAFLPGMSDFAFSNYGSFAEQGGQCAGQTLAMIHYHNRNANDNYTGNALRSESAVDNNGLPDTPDFWEDDALAYRLCAAFHKAFNTSWYGGTVYDPYRDADDRITYYSFAYAMALTHSPQILIITGTNADGTAAGHAIAVYGVTHDGLAVCDPNKPGVLTLGVPATHGSSGGKPTVDLGDYVSGATAKSRGTVYDKFSYYGTYALVDFSRAESLWNDVEAGRDVASSLFPADLSFVALTGRNDKNELLSALLTDGLQITRAQTEQVDAAKAGSLYVALPAADPDVRVRIFAGTTQIRQYDDLSQPDNRWGTLPLSAGSNDFGFLYERKGTNGDYFFVNFYRYSVRYSDSEPTLTPAVAPTSTESAVTGYGGRYRLEMVYTDECRHDGGIAGMAHSLPWVDAEHLGKTYTSEIDIPGAAFVQQASGGGFRIEIPGEAGHVFTGGISADGAFFAGTMEFKWSGDAHWATGTFKLVRIG